VNSDKGFWGRTNLKKKVSRRATTRSLVPGKVEMFFADSRIYATADEATILSQESHMQALAAKGSTKPLVNSEHFSAHSFRRFYENLCGWINLIVIPRKSLSIALATMNFKYYLCPIATID
jgi:hypothetical protein